tara:strand:- start:252 stop:539 length:288 start_codon:yes stop_codon:yes gene_type:complete
MRINRRRLRRIIRESFNTIDNAMTIVEELASFESQELNVHLNNMFGTPNIDELIKGIGMTGYFEVPSIDKLESAVYAWVERFPAEAEELLDVLYE